MKKTLGISFLDDDRFFVEGVSCALNEYFLQRGVNVCFTDGISADLIFQAVPKGDVARFCHPPNSPCGLYLSIRDRRDNIVSQLPSCQRDVGKIYRNESVSTLLNTVDRVFQSRHQLIRRISCCAWCEPLVLTQQERNVMRYLSWEMTPTSIARRLNISIKTVSTHKRAVMRKMNFCRDAELYQWLRGGALGR